MHLLIAIFVTLIFSLLTCECKNCSLKIIQVCHIQLLMAFLFLVNLYELKTYHEVIDEIYYKVNHLEPWEKGSRRTSGQTGMCGGVRGVGAGGIVSTAYCLLYKLFTLKLTRKQLNGLITHCDSPYIRALGFMYVRYTQPPNNLLDWYGPYLNDEEVGKFIFEKEREQNLTRGIFFTRKWM